MNPAREIRLVLGDQLNHQHSWYEVVDNDVVYLLAEMRQETDYAKHHVQKVISFFLAMRGFASHLKAAGHRVHYLTLDNPKNTQTIVGNLQAVIAESGATSWAYQLPDEYRLDEQLRGLQDTLGLPCEVADTEHFLTTRTHLGDFFRGKKMYLMENFYRDMRKRYGVLMDGKNPATGQWNYDSDNRKKLPAKAELPTAKAFTRDVTDVVEMLEQQGVSTIGTVVAKRFLWPVTREEGLTLLQHFVDHLLPDFGKYQDAMTTRDWSLFHSRISFVMNAKLIHPLEVIRPVEQAWREDPDRVTIAQAEGYIRQVLGWREYMRGIYWEKMPDYASLNFFNHERPLPGWFWDGNTNMRCLSHTIGQSLEYGYAHHIQRLMVTGNFALLAGIHPDEVDAWYLGIYVDAIEWVEITNTRGMSQFADGGIVGSKPYVSSANYIHKMGDYCNQCSYDKSIKTGENACPFNSLYWHFYARNREKLQRNPRIGMMYRTWDKMDGEKQHALIEHAEHVLARLEQL